MAATAVLMACCLATSLAEADPAAQARFHDELARNYYRLRNFDAALREFFLEQRLSPNPRIAFNIALCFQQIERSEDAFLYFSEYLASDDSAPERRQYAERTVESLKQVTARVLVHSEPEGADIYVDRRELGSYGRTPKVVALVPGEHNVQVELEGYRLATGKVVARRGEEVPVDLRLQQIVGHLRVTSPVGGQVIVRTAAGQTAGEGAAPFDANVAPGGYEIRVQARGYMPWAGLASVEPEKNAEVTAAPQPAPAVTGDITVTSNVPGALVELNGEPVGFSPTVLSDVRVGTHDLRVHTQATVPWTGRVEVAAEERSWLTVSLEEPPTVHRSPAMWVVAGLGAAAFATGGLFGVLASQAHSDFESAPPGTDRTLLRERGITLNTATDASLVTGAVAAGAAIVLYFATAERRGQPSSASVARSKR
jgi:outer membrane receptor for ferrienterochelin and colicins